MITKRIRIFILIVMAALLPAISAQQDSQSMIAAIKAEGLRSTEAPTLFHTLTVCDRAPADWIASACRGGALGGGTLQGLGTRQPAAGTLSVWTRMVPREAHGRDDCAALHAADRICGGMVSFDIRSSDRHPHLHRRQHRSRYRSSRPSPARRHCLMHRPQTEFLRGDRQQPSEGNGPVQTGNPPLPGPSSATPTSPR